MRDGVVCVCLSFFLKKKYTKRMPGLRWPGGGSLCVAVVAVDFPVIVDFFFSSHTGARRLLRVRHTAPVARPRKKRKEKEK